MTDARHHESSDDLPPRLPLGERVAQLEAWRDHSIEVRLGLLEREVSGLRAEVGGLRSEVGALRRELRADVGALKESMHGDIEELKRSLRDLARGTAGKAAGGAGGLFILVEVFSRWMLG